MAPLSSFSLFTFFSIWVLLFSPSQSLDCTSQKLNTTKTYTNCTDLSTLDAYLHYTYNSTNSSLSVAFIAKPPSSDGYVAWGINPNGTGMVGTQALAAVKSGSVVVAKTYSLMGYHNISESKLSFELWDLKAESDSNGNFIIYGSIKVPSETVNQVWQVGPATNGRIGKHEFASENLNAKASLALATNSSALVPGSATTNSTASPERGDGDRLSGRKMAFYACVSSLVGALMVM